MSGPKTEPRVSAETLTLPGMEIDPPQVPVIDTSGALTPRSTNDSFMRRAAAGLWGWTKEHGPLLLILLAQAVATFRLANTAFQDEATYLYVGHHEIALLLHHAPTYDTYPTYLSGSPMLYPILGAAVEGMFGLGGARNLSLIFMLLTTIALFSITRHLFGRGAAIGAAAVFALSSSVLFMGHLATFDAPALLLLALAAWIVVRFAHRSFAIALFAAPLLLLASATKYAAFAYVPSVVVLAVLAAVGVSGWWRSILRGLALGVFTAALFAVAWVATAPSLHLGVHVTFLSRALGSDTPVVVLQKSALVAGGILLLALLGAVFLCLFRRWPSVEAQRTLVRTRSQRVYLGILLLVTGLLAPASQAHLHTLTSMPKQVGFGLLFAAPLAGVALARLLGANSQDPKRLGLVLAICVALAWNGLVQSHVQFASWPNSTSLNQALRTQIRPVVGRYLVEDYEVQRYYLSDLAQPYQWAGTYTFTYTNAKGKVYTGLAAYQQALTDKYFDVVVLRFGPTATLDEELLPLLSTGTSYSLIATEPVTSTLGDGSWYIYRANR
jgi:Dolichyl-phosphate-mannose-protein mannosyltransferase